MSVAAEKIILPVREPKETSRPLTFWLPEEYKSADFNAKQGLITAYLTVYNDPSTGQPFVDPYMDVIVPGSFSKTISELSSARSRKDTPYLCADLWQHDRREPIGGIKGLTEDSKGVIYEAQLLMSVQRAREAFELAAAKMIGSSYGYDPIRFENKGDLRHLIEIRLHEVSQVTFPANDVAPILDTKDAEGKKNFYVPSNMPTFPDIPTDENFSEELEEELLQVKAVVGNTSLPIGPRDEDWDAGKALAQYKAWGTDGDGKAIPAKYKQVYLKLDGNPTLRGSYSYPIGYIVNGKPHICVGAVVAAYNAVKGARSTDIESVVLSKISTIYARINAKYPDEPKFVVEKGLEYAIEWKQDFSDVWTQKLPSQLITQFFRMCDTLTYVLLNNFNDDDVEDKPGVVDTCLAQFGEVVKAWLPDYEAADAAQDATEGNESEDSMMPMGYYSANMSAINLKRAVEDYETKKGAAISSANKKKLQTIIDAINGSLGDLGTFLVDTVGAEEQGEPAETDSGTTGKAVPEMPEYIHDITQGLTVLSTLAPGTTTSPMPQNGKAIAPMSFPKLDGYQEEEQEVTITDFLQSIQQVMGVRSDASNNN